MTEQFRGGHPQRWIIFQPRLNRSVIDRVWIQLPIDPLCQSHLPYALDIARPRAIRQTVQRMQNRLIRAELGDRQADRKSTRLNSSHANISYAVFCLKKKKKK